MSRTLAPLSEERIKYYEEKIENAYSQNNKKEVRRLKRLFSVYIKKRGLDITFFKDQKIYRYFDKPQKINRLKKELENLKTEKDEKDNEKKLAKDFIKSFGKSDFGKSVRKYFSKMRNEIDVETRIYIRDFFKYYKGEIVGTIKDKIRIIEYEIEQIENKNMYMRRYRKRANLGVIDNIEIENILVDIEKMKNEYNKYEKKINDLKEKQKNLTGKLNIKIELIEMLADLYEKDIMPCIWLVDLQKEGLLSNTKISKRQMNNLKMLLKQGIIDKRRYDDSVYFIKMINQPTIDT